MLGITKTSALLSSLALITATTSTAQEQTYTHQQACLDEGYAYCATIDEQAVFTFEQCVAAVSSICANAGPQGGGGGGGGWNAYWSGTDSRIRICSSLLIDCNTN